MKDEVLGDSVGDWYQEKNNLDQGNKDRSYKSSWFMAEVGSEEERGKLPHSKLTWLSVIKKYFL